MRIAFAGAGKLAVMTARRLLESGHEVVMIEKDKSRIEELSEGLDCGFLHGDGSKPGVLREVGPEDTDFLFCLTGNDEANIIASLVGRSLGFSRVVAKIEDPELVHICTELGLEDTIVPTMTISRFLTDIVAGRDILELSSMIKGEARFFSFFAREEDELEIKELGLPDEARVICYYRDDKFMLPEEGTRLKKGDEVVILAHSNRLKALRERFLAASVPGEKSAEGPDVRTQG